MVNPYEVVEEAALDMAIQGRFGVWFQALAGAYSAKELYERLPAGYKDAAYAWATCGRLDLKDSLK